MVEKSYPPFAPFLASMSVRPIKQNESLTFDLLHTGQAGTLAGKLWKTGKEEAMITAELTLAKIGLIAATRVLLGGSLCCVPTSAEQRKAVGWTLVGVVETSKRQDVVTFTVSGHLHE